MFNFSNIFKIIGDASNFQKKIQKELREKKITGESGAGMVKVKMNAYFEVENVEIDESIANNKDKKFLEDMVSAAFNDAANKSRNEIIEHLKASLGAPDFSGFFK